MRNRREDPRPHQETIVGRNRRQRMTHDEDGAELKQRPLARLGRGERDNDRSPNGHADRIAADQKAGSGNLTPRSEAMSGSKPTTANSVVPMANVARKSAKSKGDMGTSQ